MIRDISLVLAACLTLISCQSEPNSSAKASKAIQKTDPADMELRATSDLLAPAPIKQLSFVPNNVASWLGHIIMVDANGDLHRATTNSQVIAVKQGNYVDVIGLDRPNKAGAFLALTQDKKVHAFIETDNEGNFKSIPVTQAKTSIESFCQSNDAPENQLWARTQKGEIAAYDITFPEESSAVLIHKPDVADKNACEPLTLKSDGLTLAVKPNSPFLHFDDKKAEIVKGLSIEGMTTPGYAALTHENMGSVFADGILIAADSETGRLTFIARSYIMKTMAGEN